MINIEYNGGNGNSKADSTMLPDNCPDGERDASTGYFTV